MIMYAYEIKNLVNGKRYFGISINPKRRFNHHKTERGSKILTHTFKKYGIENFSFTVFAAGSEEYIKDLEVRAIAYFNTIAPNGYNLTVGGDGIQNPSQEIRAKISATKRGIPLSKEHCENLSKAGKGRIFSREHCENLSKAAKGRTLSEKTKVKIGAISRGRILSAETKAKISKANERGKHYSAKRVLIDGQEFDCIKDAAEALGINYNTLNTRFHRWKKTNTFPEDYSYIDE